MIKLTKLTKSISVTTNEGCYMILALCEGGSRRNIERQQQV